MELTNKQAVDKVYAMLNRYKFFTKGKQPLSRQPLEIEQVNEFGMINPGIKDMYNIIDKLWRKAYKDAKNPNDKEGVLNQYNQREAELFNTISDYSRFTIIIPNYQSLPALLAYFLSEFGGEVIIHDEAHDHKGDYQGVHLHFNYKGVNCELQFYTKPEAELKQATDHFYHAYVNVPSLNNSAIKEQYDAQLAEITEYCQVIYQRSDFKASLPEIESVVAAYNGKQNINFQPRKRMKLSHFCEVWRKAELVQRELAERLPRHLIKFSEIEKDTTVLGK